MGILITKTQFYGWDIIEGKKPLDETNWRIIDSVHKHSFFVLWSDFCVTLTK